LAEERERGAPIGKLDLITVVVQRGRAERIVKRALKAGAGGATIWFARGSGIRERLGLLGIAISPEKEVIIIVTDPKITDAVFDAVVKAGKLDVPGHGIAFVTEVKKSAGFFAFEEVEKALSENAGLDVS